MGKEQPKIILNLQLENEELEKRIQIAVDKYVESVIDKNLESIVQKIVTKRISNILLENRYSDDNTIDGLSLKQYIKKETYAKIDKYIHENIDQILSTRLASLIKGN